MIALSLFVTLNSVLSPFQSHQVTSHGYAVRASAWDTCIGTLAEDGTISLKLVGIVIDVLPQGEHVHSVMASRASAAAANDFLAALERYDWKRLYTDVLEHHVNSDPYESVLAAYLQLMKLRALGATSGASLVSAREILHQIYLKHKDDRCSQFRTLSYQAELISLLLGGGSASEREEGLWALARESSSSCPRLSVMAVYWLCSEYTRRGDTERRRVVLNWLFSGPAQGELSDMAAVMTLKRIEDGSGKTGVK
jgi:hypothetical protein